MGWEQRAWVGGEEVKSEKSRERRERSSMAKKAEITDGSIEEKKGNIGGELRASCRI